MQSEKRGFFLSFAVGALLLAAGTRPSAGAVSIGTLGNAIEFNYSATPATIVDLAHGATANGSLTSATVIWSGGPCTNAFKIKFFRPAQGAVAFLGERGPFAAADGFVTVSLSPAMAVQAGDLIGISQLKAGCGGVVLTTDGSGLRHVVSDSGDITTTLTLAQGGESSESLAVQAVGGATEVYSGTVVGVGSAQGAGSSNFKTAIQLSNPGPLTIRGHLVFHPIGHSASPSDPSLAYALTPSQTTSYADIVASMGASGLGSLDIFTNASYPPAVITRVFNDAGAAGTFGYSEPVVHPDDVFVLHDYPNEGISESTTLVTPADVSKFRFNVGVRSLSAGATLAIEVDDAGGGFLKNLTRTYAADDFELTSGQDFLGGLAIGPNQTIQIRVTSGSAIVCGIPVENTSNDTSFQLGDRRRY